MGRGGIASTGQTWSAMWKVIFSYQVRDEVADAALWYEARQSGLGWALVDELVQIWRELAVNPNLAARKHPKRNLRWRCPKRFPYRVIYEVDEVNRSVLVVAVVHASRSDVGWRDRL